MMSARYKPRIPITEAVCVSNPITQASEIAALLSPASFSVDLASGSASFTMYGEDGQPGKTITVEAGQTIATTNGLTTIYNTNTFNDLFMPEFPV